MSEARTNAMRVPFNDGSGLFFSSGYAFRRMGVIERGVLLRRVWHDEDRRPGNPQDLHVGVRGLSLDPDGGLR
jgi:hypothetical protein